MPAIVAFIWPATASVLTVNVTEVFPARTITVAGRVADFVLLVKSTFMPLLGAGAVSSTVPFEVDPPATTLGKSVIDASPGGLIVRFADLLVPLSVAVIKAVSSVETVEVETENVAELLPAGTDTLAGTFAEGEPLESFTRTPPVGAGPERVTDPDEAKDPVTVDGSNANDDKLAGLI